MPVHYNYAIHAKLLTKCPKLTEQHYTSNMHVAFYNNNCPPQLNNF